MAQISSKSSCFTTAKENFATYSVPTIFYLATVKTDRAGSTYLLWASCLWATQTCCLYSQMTSQHNRLTTFSVSYSKVNTNCDPLPTKQFWRFLEAKYCSTACRETTRVDISCMAGAWCHRFPVQLSEELFLVYDQLADNLGPEVLPDIFPVVAEYWVSIFF